jgi:hypothetical protein
MEAQPPNYHREFFKSPQHAWFGLLTLGLGFLSAQPLFLLLGATAYSLGWVYLPDLGFFRQWVDRKYAAERQQVSQAQLDEFIRRREAMLAELTKERRARYAALTAVCQEIEKAGQDDALASADPNADPRLRKLDDLMWTYLRLISLDQKLELFLAVEQGEDLPQQIRDTEAEIAVLAKALEALKTGGDAAARDAKERLRDSRLELLDVLRKREQRGREAQSNLDLVRSEEERLYQQIKLIRADALAVKNTGSLTARIDATVEHLTETNKWISELGDFQDLVGDLPQTEARVGYKPTTPPPLVTAAEPPQMVRSGLGTRRPQREGEQRMR